jgi:hypothetical protein
MKGALAITGSDSDDDCQTSFSDDDDITVTSSTKIKEMHVSNRTSLKQNPPERKTTAIVTRAAARV